MPGITMGSCSSLQGIELSSKVTVRLDVRGCGGLQQLHLDCPALQVLDANFCGSLSDEGLASAVANLPPLRQLALSVCCQVSGDSRVCFGVGHGAHTWSMVQVVQQLVWVELYDEPTVQLDGYFVCDTPSWGTTSWVAHIICCLCTIGRQLWLLGVGQGQEVG